MRISKLDIHTTAIIISVILFKIELVNCLLGSTWNDNNWT